MHYIELMSENKQIARMESLQYLSFIIRAWHYCERSDPVVLLYHMHHP